ncbi:regulator of G-protein signaling 16-like isoform X2 [Ambystoma mexicanum]|uniref:regulator of G-protein signaling 16-like isoform X2 n=1 Tax=Ambystoma mexicanum TaxID=8296 RepID=UPI0037E94F86
MAVKEFGARLAVLLQKTEAVLEPGKCSQNKQRSKHRPCLEDVLRWRDSFDNLLSSKDGLAAFWAFLKTEFSDENLEFWLACEKYKKTRTAAKLPSQALKIYQEFIQNEAPREVNIDHHTKELTQRQLAHATHLCFDVAQGKTWVLMEKDSYPRFLRSALYQDLLDHATQHGGAKPSHT